VSQERENLSALAEQLGALARRLGAARAGESPTGAGSPTPGLEAVQIANELAATAAVALRLSVDSARAAGRTWQELGYVLGVSRQAAFQRFGHPVDPRTGEPMSRAVLPGAAEKATQLLIDWIDERYDRVAADFSDAVTAKISESGGLAAAWAQLIGMVGAYGGMGEPLTRQAGDLTIVEIPLSFEASEMKGRVVYDRQGKVAGLWVLRPDAI
jgi:hypothetical protein